MTFGVRVEVIDFKNSVPSAVVPNEDGGYTIFLNSRLCYERMQDAYIHELKHIEQLDFEKENTDFIELKTHFT